MNELQERSKTATPDDQVLAQKQVQPQADGQDPTWAGSPETAGAKESVRRDAKTTLADDQLDQLTAELSIRTPSEELALTGGEVVGPEIVAEVAEQEQQQGLKKRAVGEAFGVVMAGAAAANGQPGAQNAIDGVARGPRGGDLGGQGARRRLAAAERRADQDGGAVRRGLLQRPDPHRQQ